MKLLKIVFAAVVGIASLTSNGYAADENIAALNEKLSKLLPGQTPDAVNETPVPGLYEAVYGTEVYYLTANARYLVRGEIIDLMTRTNLTEEKRSGGRLELLAQVPESSMIVYTPKDKTKHTVTVFTDIDCGYCQKLHKGMAQMNDLGIEIRYLAYPRAGIGSTSFNKAVRVWCSDDRNSAMDAAKAGKPVDAPLNCDNPVKEHFALGQAVGVRGTPAMLLEDGTLLPGYLPPQRLLAELNKH